MIYDCSLCYVMIFAVPYSAYSHHIDLLLLPSSRTPHSFDSFALRLTAAVSFRAGSFVVELFYTIKPITHRYQTVIEVHVLLLLIFLPIGLFNVIIYTRLHHMHAIAMRGSSFSQKLVPPISPFYVHSCFVVTRKPS